MYRRPTWMFYILPMVRSSHQPWVMLHSLLGAGHDPLCQQLLPEDSITNTEEEADVLRNHQRITRTPADTPDGLVPPGSSPSRWGVMGSILGRLTRSSSSSTSSSGVCDQQPCTLISVDRLQSSTRNAEFSAPIVGYEVMEERARFTVFKVRVEHQTSGRHWYVFRRYTDFARLNRKLRVDFCGLRFALPPKRWFGDNFDPLFLEDRVLGLQAFMDNIIAHKDISKCACVREFFCLDDPPGPDDSLDESRALCENLEDAVIRLQEVVRQRDREVDFFKTEVSMLRSQQQALLKSLKLQSRLASVACAQLQDEQEEKMDSSQSKQFLEHLQKVNHFNMSLAKTIERTVKSGSLSDLGSRLSLTRVEEENQAGVTPIATDSSDFIKTPSMDDICSRSTGDGSTGSQERLPPLGQVAPDPNPELCPMNVLNPRLRTLSTPDFHNNVTTISIHDQLPQSTELSREDDFKSRTCFRSDVPLNFEKEVVVSQSVLPVVSQNGAPVVSPCFQDLKLNNVSFKKLLENNPDINENQLNKSPLCQPAVLPLSSISLLST